MATHEANVAISISGDFIDHVRRLLTLALEDLAERPTSVTRRGMNWHSAHALPAYITAVASVESFVNEHFLSGMLEPPTKDSPLLALMEDLLPELELRKKLLLVPQLAFGKTLDPGRAPYQDMALLVRVRNDLVHYKMSTAPPKYLTDLAQRGIAFNGPGDRLYGWVYTLSTSEGIRWAHNVACGTVKALTELIPDGTWRVAKTMALNFKSIPEEWVRDNLTRLGLNPEADRTPTP